MMRKSSSPIKTIQRDQWASLVLFLAMLVGAVMRFNPASLAGFPVNDGGMFAVMIEELKANHYLLPAFTSYNSMDIPFVYPPLGLYLGSLASDLLGWSSITAVRWLPALFSTLSIPALYLLAGRVLKDKYRAAIAALFFAMMPRAFSWFIMGGGLTRALGQLFMLLTLASLVRLYEENRRTDVFLAGFFGGLAVMSHPEAAVYSLASALFLWIMLSPNRTGLLNSLYVASITLFVSAPWWATVVKQHGFEPLLTGAETGQRVQVVVHLLLFYLTEEPYATVIAVLGLIGIAYCLYRKSYLLPLWLVVPFLVAGRSASGFAVIPLSMLAAIGLVDVVFAAFRNPRMNEVNELVPPAERNILLFLLVYLIVSTYQYGLGLSTMILYPPEREAMVWVRDNTPQDARFLVLTGDASVFCDAVSEWFPALTRRQSLTTIQGTEWLEGKNFLTNAGSKYTVQKCLSGGDVSCLDAAVDRSNYEYVYLSKEMHSNNCAPTGAPIHFDYFVEQIRQDPNFKNIYEAKDAIIFGK